MGNLAVLSKLKKMFTLWPRILLLGIDLSDKPPHEWNNA